MKKFKICGAIACALLAGTTLTSCFNNDNSSNPQTFSANLPKSLNCIAVKSLGEGERSWKAYDGASITYAYNFTEGKFTFQASELRVTDISILTFSLPETSFSVATDGAWTSRAMGPFAVAASGSSVNISNVNTYLRIPDSCPAVVSTEFTVNDQYLVRVLPLTNYFGGTSETSFENGSPSFQLTTPYYNCWLDNKTMTAEIEVFGIKFSPNQTGDGLTLAFRNVPFTITDNGITLQAESVTPCALSFNSSTGRPEYGAPMENYKMTNLYGNMVVAKSFYLHFEREGVGAFTFSGTPLVKMPGQTEE